MTTTAPGATVAPTTPVRSGPPPIRLATTHKPAARLSFARQLGVEARKLVDSRAGTWILIIGLLVAAAIVALTVVGLVLVHNEMKKQGAPIDKVGWMDLSQGSSQFVLMVLALLGILLATAEFSQRTALTTFALDPRRLRVLAAKTLVIVGLSLAIAALAYPVGALVTLLVDGLTHQGIDWGWSWAKFGGFLLVAVVSGLGGLAFGLLTLSSPIAIVLWFVIPMALGVLSGLGQVLEPLRKVQGWVSPSDSTQGLLSGHMTGTLWGQFATTTLLWTVLPAAIGVWRWLRSEVK